MKKNKKIILVISLAVVIIFAASLVWQSNSPTGAVVAEQLNIRVGYLPVLVNLPLFVALEEGYFEKYNLRLEAIEAQSPNHVLEAIIAGHLDGAGILADPILFAAEAKYPNEIKIFATTDETSNNYVASIIVREDSGINTIEDLKGKKIGVYTGLVQVLFLKSILAGMGFDPETDVEIVQIAPRLQLQGLESGQYDALSTVEPFVTIAKSKSIGEVLIKNPRVKYIQEPFPSVATPISTEFIEKHPETVRAYLLAYRDAVDFIRSNPEKAKVYLAKYTPITEDVAKDVTLPRFNQFGEEDRENIQKYADWMLDKGLLSKQIDVNSMFGEFEG
ncbi:ABC transporter substrate-binding protein [Candidatus Woesearchaeota archaeon]|nr:ABC transporter substrate-binding protein [Candidatus Woesearchaeota archaeon]